MKKSYSCLRYCVRFTSKNYSARKFQLETFLKGKESWDHIDDNAKEGSTTTKKTTWVAKDNQIMTWILVSMEPPHLIISLSLHKSANVM